MIRSPSGTSGSSRSLTDSPAFRFTRRRRSTVCGFLFAGDRLQSAPPAADLTEGQSSRHVVSTSDPDHESSEAPFPRPELDAAVGMGHRLHRGAGPGSGIRPGQFHPAALHPSRRGDSKPQPAGQLYHQHQSRLGTRRKQRGARRLQSGGCTLDGLLQRPGHHQHQRRSDRRIRLRQHHRADQLGAAAGVLHHDPERDGFRCRRRQLPRH